MDLRKGQDDEARLGHEELLFETINAENTLDELDRASMELVQV